MELMPRGESFYETPRAQVATTLRAVLAFPAIRVLDADQCDRPRASAYGCPGMSTEISTASVVPLFSSQ